LLANVHNISHEDAVDSLQHKTHFIYLLTVIIIVGGQEQPYIRPRWIAAESKLGITNLAFMELGIKADNSLYY